MFWNLLVVTVALVLSFNVHAAGEPQIVSVALEKSYTPIGFDDNDKVQVTVTGTFPSSCYKVGAAQTKIDKEKKTVQIWQSAYKYGGICLQMRVPFTQVVDVGLVDQGNYAFIDGPTGRALGKLMVERSSHAGPDDFLYLPVRDAFLINGPQTRKSLMLTGTLYDRCTEVQEIKVSYYPEVIVVQPIAKHTGELRCEPTKTGFTRVVELDPDLKGTYLLHVRSMDGQAINKIVETDLE